MSDVLKHLSDELANLVSATSPSIVRVDARRRLPATGLVWSADGLIVTADHVVRSDEIAIGLDDGHTVAASLVGRDPTTGIALLKAEAEDLQPANWGNTDDLMPGSLVLALGRPDQAVMATLGVVMAVDKGWQTRMGGNIDQYLQTDVVMYPGFSGGPLVGAGQAVLGMNNSSLARGVSLTLPAATLRRVAADLAEHGHIQRGYLGIGIQPVELPEDLAEQLDQDTGVLLVSVEPNSPAAEAKLHLGDVLVQLDGEPVQSIEELLMLLSGDRVGKDVTAQVVRAGEVHEVSVTIGLREASEDEAEEDGHGHGNGHHRHGHGHPGRGQRGPGRGRGGRSRRFGPRR